MNPLSQDGGKRRRRRTGKRVKRAKTSTKKRVKRRKSKTRKRRR